MVNCSGLYDNCKVSAGTHRQVVTNHAVAEIFRVSLLKAETIVFLVLVPVLQTDDKVDGLGVPYGRSTEQCLDIDDSDTAQLDQMFGHIGRGTDQSILADLSKLHHIICYKTMSSLDQFQRSLGFTDTAFAGDQHTLAVYVNQYAVHGDTGSELYIQPSDGLCHENGGCLLRTEDRNSVRNCLLHENRIGR